MMFLGIAERCNTLIKVVKLKRRFSRFFAVFYTPMGGRDE